MDVGAGAVKRGADLGQLLQAAGAIGALQQRPLAVAGQALELQYEVYAFDASVRTAFRPRFGRRPAPAG